MFLVCGEALFDLFGEDTGGADFHFDARIGGSPLNVAMGLSRLGETACFFGGVSTDPLGEKLMRFLQKEKIGDQYVVRNAQPTTLSLVQKDANGHPAYNFYGTASADRTVHLSDIPNFAEQPRFIHIGSYAALVDPVASTFRALLEREHGRSLVSFDPNIRPTVVSDMDLWRTNTEHLLPLCDIVKVSDEDLELLAPGAALDQVAEEWLSKGPKLVVVTLGGHGAMAFHANGQISHPGKRITVEDTVGAGDTFQATLLHGLKRHGVASASELSELNETALNHLLDLAIQAAAITCSRRGANLPHSFELYNSEKAALGG